MSKARNSKIPPARVWQRMLSGRRLDLLDPSPLDIEVEDIAHGLARVARWNGQTVGSNAFSVAEHSVIVERICSELSKGFTPEDGLTALLHDAPEYVIGDMISPFKAVLGDSYKTIEQRLENAIHLRFGLPATCSPALKKLIKKADQICAWFEATQLAGFTKTEATKLFGKPPAKISLTLNPKDIPAAQASFLARFNDLYDTVHMESHT